MAATVPSLAAVETVVTALGGDGTPLTTAEVAAEFTCSDRTVYNRLSALVDDGGLRTKKVGARARVWWRPRAPAGSPADEINGVPDERFRDVLEASPVGIVIVDATGAIRLANRRAEDILGLTRDEMATRTYRQPEWQISHEDGTPITPGEHPVTRVLETGDPIYGFEHRIELEDGRERWLSSNSAPLRSAGGDVEYVVVGLEDITRQRAREQVVETQRNELDRLYRVNSVIRSIDRAVVQATTREQIELAVCERIAASDPYLFAVVGEFSQSYEVFTPRTFAGIGGSYLEQMLESDDAPPLSEGAGATAARTREVQVVQDLEELSNRFWQETAHEEGFQSYASVPLVYRDAVYGVLGVYASQPGAFDEKERRVLAELGEIIGHACNAIERRNALLVETVEELEFRQRGRLAAALEPLTDGEATVAVDRTVHLGDGTAVQYYTVTGVDPEAFTAALTGLPSVESVRRLGQQSDGARFEVRTAGETMATLVATHGGRTTTQRFADGEVHLVVEVPFGTDVTHLTDVIQRHFPGARFVSRRTRERSQPTSVAMRESALEQLTDRQRSVLEAAYAAGFFDWPRDSSGEALADSLGIASATFHKHVRIAEGKLMASLFA